MKNELLSTLLLSNQSVRIMVSMLEEEGIDAGPLLKQAKITNNLINNPEGKISCEQENIFQLAYANATKGLPGFWMKTGQRYRLMSYGPMGLAVMAAKKVRDGLNVISSFQALTYSLMQYIVEEDENGQVILRADDSSSMPELRPFLHERALGSVTLFLNDMLQMPFPLKRIESILPYEPNWQNCEQTLGTKVIFNSENTRWIFDDNLMDKDLPMANSQLEKTYQQICAKLIDDSKYRDPIVKSVYETLVRANHGVLTASQLANSLNISERTLHRRLAANNKNLGNIIDEVRIQRAKEILTSSSLSIETISEMLNYSETSSFSRAFKRVTGQSPSQYRIKQMT